QLEKTSHQDRSETMKLRPLHDRVVITRIEAEEKTTGGIIIPDTAKEKPQQGEVIAVGPGGRDESGKLIPIDVKVGDRVPRSIVRAFFTPAPSMMPRINVGCLTKALLEFFSSRAAATRPDPKRAPDWASSAHCGRSDRS